MINTRRVLLYKHYCERRLAILTEGRKELETKIKAHVTFDTHQKDA